jgi:hypothetical protein
MLKQSLAGVGSFALHPRAALFIACRDRPSRCVLACPAGVVRSRLLFEHHQLESDRRLHHVSVSGPLHFVVADSCYFPLSPHPGASIDCSASLSVNNDFT